MTFTNSDDGITNKKYEPQEFVGGDMSEFYKNLNEVYPKSPVLGDSFHGMNSEQKMGNGTPFANNLPSSQGDSSPQNPMPSPSPQSFIGESLAESYSKKPQNWTTDNAIQQKNSPTFSTMVNHSPKLSNLTHQYVSSNSSQDSNKSTHLQRPELLMLLPRNSSVSGVPNDSISNSSSNHQNDRETIKEPVSGDQLRSATVIAKNSSVSMQGVGKNIEAPSSLLSKGKSQLGTAEKSNSTISMNRDAFLLENRSPEKEGGSTKASPTSTSTPVVAKKDKVKVVQHSVTHKQLMALSTKNSKRSDIKNSKKHHKHHHKHHHKSKKHNKTKKRNQIDGADAVVVKTGSSSFNKRSKVRSTLPHSVVLNKTEISKEVDQLIKEEKARRHSVNTKPLNATFAKEAMLKTKLSVNPHPTNLGVLNTEPSSTLVNLFSRIVHNLNKIDGKKYRNSNKRTDLESEIRKLILYGKSGKIGETSLQVVRNLTEIGRGIKDGSGPLAKHLKSFIKEITTDHLDKMGETDKKRIYKILESIERSVIPGLTYASKIQDDDTGGLTTSDMEDIGLSDPLEMRGRIIGDALKEESNVEGFGEVAKKVHIEPEITEASIKPSPRLLYSIRNNDLMLENKLIADSAEDLIKDLDSADRISRHHKGDLDKKDATDRNADLILKDDEEDASISADISNDVASDLMLDNFKRLHRNQSAEEKHTPGQHRDSVLVYVTKKKSDETETNENEDASSKFADDEMEEGNEFKETDKSSTSTMLNSKEESKSKHFAKDKDDSSTVIVHFANKTDSTSSPDDDYIEADSAKDGDTDSAKDGDTDLTKDSSEDNKTKEDVEGTNLEGSVSSDEFPEQSMTGKNPRKPQGSGESGDDMRDHDNPESENIKIPISMKELKRARDDKNEKQSMTGKNPRKPQGSGESGDDMRDHDNPESENIKIPISMKELKRARDDKNEKQSMTGKNPRKPQGSGESGDDMRDHDNPESENIKIPISMKNSKFAKSKNNSHKSGSGSNRFQGDTKHHGDGNSIDEERAEQNQSAGGGSDNEKDGKDSTQNNQQQQQQLKNYADKFEKEFPQGLSIEDKQHEDSSNLPQHSSSQKMNNGSFKTEKQVSDKEPNNNEDSKPTNANQYSQNNQNGKDGKQRFSGQKQPSNKGNLHPSASQSVEANADKGKGDEVSGQDGNNDETGGSSSSNENNSRFTDDSKAKGEQTSGQNSKDDSSTSAINSSQSDSKDSDHGESKDKASSKGKDKKQKKIQLKNFENEDVSTTSEKGSSHQNKNLSSNNLQQKESVEEESVLNKNQNNDELGSKNPPKNTHQQSAEDTSSEETSNEESSRPSAETEKTSDAAIDQIKKKLAKLKGAKMKNGKPMLPNKFLTDIVERVSEQAHAMGLDQSLMSPEENIEDSKANPSKMEDSKEKASKTEELKSNPSKMEDSKEKASKTEKFKSAASKMQGSDSKVSLSKEEHFSSEESKANPSKMEEPKQESSKLEDSKEIASAGEDIKHDSPKMEQSKEESSKIEQSKDESSKMDEPKEDAAKSDAAKEKYDENNCHIGTNKPDILHGLSGRVYNFV